MDILSCGEHQYLSSFLLNQQEISCRNVSDSTSKPHTLRSLRCFSDEKEGGRSHYVGHLLFPLGHSSSKIGPGALHRRPEPGQVSRVTPDQFVGAAMLQTHGHAVTHPE